MTRVHTGVILTFLTRFLGDVHLVRYTRLTVAAIVMWSALVATVLPPPIKKPKVDSAAVSPPPTTAMIVDGTGLLICLLIAT